MSPERELLASLGKHRLPALATGVLIALGIAAGFGGIAWGAVLILAGLACSALVDTRLPILLLLLLIAPLTLFHPLPAFELAGSVIDFRLLMTGGIGILLAVELALLRPRWDIVGVVGICYVALLVLLVPLNEYGPLRAIAPVARFWDYVLAFLVARRVLTTAGDGRLAIGAVFLGLSIVAASGLLQFAAGPVLERDGAPRLAGLYVTSPVGLGMAMELGLIVLWVGFLRAGRWKDRTWLAAAALFAVFLFVTLETSTRLVFASLVAGLVLVELLHRRLAIAGGILVASAVLLVLQPNLAGRIASTVGGPAATPAPTSAAGPPAVVEEKLPGDPSLRYRLYIWYEMLPEWGESPVLGRGTGSFAVLLERRTGILREAPHNDYFGLLVETGLVGLAAYLLLQLTILAAAVIRWRLARLASARALLVTAGVAYFAMSVLSILNNPMLFLDLQIILWALLGVAFAVPRFPSGHPEVISSVVGERRGITSVPSQLINPLRLIWRDRPTELAAAGRVGRGVVLAAHVADVRLTATAPPERSE